DRQRQSPDRTGDTPAVPLQRRERRIADPQHISATTVDQFVERVQRQLEAPRRVREGDEDGIVGVGGSGLHRAQIGAGGLQPLEFDLSTEITINHFVYPTVY